MTPEQFADRLEADARFFDRSAATLRAAGGDARDYEAPLVEALAGRCRELASEARITGAASFDQMEDRREALSRSAAAPPNRGGFRFKPRRPQAAPTSGRGPGADVFDPEAAEGWPAYPAPGVDDVRYATAR